MGINNSHRRWNQFNQVPFPSLSRALQDQWCAQGTRRAGRFSTRILFGNRLPGSGGAGKGSHLVQGLGWGRGMRVFCRWKF